MFMQLMSWERGNAALYPRFYTSLRGLPYRKGPFSHHLSVSEAVTLHINGPNGPDDWHQELSIFLSPPLTVILYLCILFLSFPVCLWLSAPPPLAFSLCPVFSILGLLSINHLSYHCDILWPHWGSLWCDLASSWFSCRVILCMSVPLSVAHNSDTVSFPASAQLFILFSCERMELSRCITDFSFSGQAYCFPWPLHLKSVETGLFFMSINGLLSWIHEGMLAFWSSLRGYCTVLSQGA